MATFYICSYILGRSSLFPIDDGLLDDGHNDQVGVLNSPTCYSAHQNGERIERFSRKVFVGGLPPDIDEGKMMTCDTKEKNLKYSVNGDLSLFLYFVYFTYRYCEHFFINQIFI